MFTDSLVSFNIYNIDTNKLYNKNSFVPVLYYWNGENDMLSEIINSDKFIKNYLNNISDEDTLSKIVISYFYFYYDDDQEEKYTEGTVFVKDYIDFKKVENDNLLLDIIYNKIVALYRICIDKNYLIIDKKDLEVKIVNLYNTIKEKYKERVTKETIGNWIRSELIKDKKYNSKNISLIINLFNQII